ncbi:DUF4328 domain-containing protein [Haloferula sp.]|uniref:DUF4328 domain-containing protein n=1 Tax=Haloferula sp. TaxID=2497595 RepID=UPI003C73FAA9
MPANEEGLPGTATNPYQTPSASLIPPPLSADRERQGPYGPFINTAGLSRVVVGLVLICAILEVIIAIVSGFELSLLKSGGADAYLEGETHSWLLLAIGGSAILWLILYLVTVVAFSKWIIRSSKNAWLFAHQSGQRTMTITPGWAVGYFFIPIINLWKPYTAMREIRDATDASLLRSILPFWWTAWILSSVIGQISFRLGNKADTVESYITSSVFDLATLPVSIVLTVLAIQLVRDMTRGQLERAGIETEKSTDRLRSH